MTVRQVGRAPRRNIRGLALDFSWWLWFVAIAVFLSLMRFKRADYLLPAYPGAALWLGCLVERHFSRLSQKGARNQRTLKAWAGFGQTAKRC